MVNRKSGVRAVALTGALALTLAACAAGGGNASSSGSSSSGSSGATGDKKGGTLHILIGGDKFAHLDPQRNYTGTDLAFAGAFMHRTLTTYAVASGDAGTKIVPDMATDIGTPDATAKTWKFTLRDGLTWQDGSKVTCEDVRYGISRTFAGDVITDGPQYATSMLDIPQSGGKSIYPGPFKANATQQAAFDKSIDCAGNAITFHLSRPVPDFNGALTLLSFGAVPKAQDKGEGYDKAPFSDGPYKIQSYTEKKSLVLVRNDKWTQASDPVRKAYPDTIEVDFSLNPAVIDQRLLKSSGDDAFAVSNSGVDPSDVAQVFADPTAADRRSDQLDPFVRYYAINTKAVPNVKHRQALMAALDREALRKVAGGIYAGDFADGVVKPNIGQDYAPTGLWDGLLGESVPPTGNIALAKKLIQESGQTPPEIKFDYGKDKDDQTADKAAAIAKTSWEKAGFKVTLNPIESSQYYPTVQDTTKQGSVSGAGWGPDWLNASTVLPSLFTSGGGFDLSQWDDKTFAASVDKANTTVDRAQQASQWQAINKQAVQQGLVIPTRFGKEQLIFGKSVKTASTADGKPYTDPAFGGPSFADLYIAK